MRRRYGLVCVFVFAFFSGFFEVNAESATFKRGTLYCSNATTGAYAGKPTCGSKETWVYYKEVGGQPAYCPQVNKSAPSGNVTVNAITSYGTVSGTGSWTQKKALVAGQIMEILNAREDDSKIEKYMYVSAALNTYLNFSSAKDYSGKVVTNAIDKAKETKFYTSSKIVGTPISVKFASDVLKKHSSGYYFGQVNVTLKNEYEKGIGNIKYTSSCTGCVLYKDQWLTQPFTGEEVAPGDTKSLVLYVKASSGVSSVSVGINGNIAITYPIAKMWRYNSSKQVLITASTITYNPTASMSAIASVPVETVSDPEPVPTKYVNFYKLNSNGSVLSGADVKVEFPGIGKSCNTASNSKCSLNFNNDVSSVDYKITEIKAPDGYIISAAIEDKWTIGVNKSTCYRASNLSDSSKKWEELSSVADCDSGYSKKEVCLDANKNVVEGVTSLEQCTAINDMEGNDTEIDDGSSEGDNQVSTADETDGENTEPEGGNTETGGEDSDTTGSDTPTEDENKREWTTLCYDKNGQVNAPDDNGVTKCDYDYVKVTSSGYNLHLTMTNELNSVSFSKRNVNNKGIEGAKLKVCEKQEYDEMGRNCEIYKTVSGDLLSWYSGSGNMTFTGFKVGTYYLIEEEPALGYILNKDVVEFSIDNNGKVTLGEKTGGELDEGVIVLKNEITKISISKADIATSKEVPGATITICETIKDENNNYQMVVGEGESGGCGAAVLSDGSYARWVSTDKPHNIVGLPAGTYFLVEEIAPDGYSTAESILFTLKEDGTLVDKDGKSLDNNKITMFDKKIEELKTGMLSFYIVLGILIVGSMLGFGTYYYLQKKHDIVRKIRKRKVHKM